VLNKIDLVKPKDKVLPLISKLNETNIFSQTFITAAIDGYKVEDLKEYLVSRARPKEWEFAADVKSDNSPLQIVEEIIREKYFQRTNQEVPYGLKQVNVGWTDLPDGALRVDQNIIVPKLAQKAILIGKKGKNLKTVVKETTADLKEIFNRTVYLNLMVQYKKQVQTR